MNNADIFIKNNRLYAFEDLTLLYSDINSDEPIWYSTEIPFYLANIPSLSQNNITSVFFPSQDTGYLTVSPTAVLDPIEGNGYDIILKTFDRGLTWYRQIIDTIDLATTSNNPSLHNILFVNDSVGFACGLHKIFKTTNRGGGIITDLIKTNQFNPLRIIQNENYLIIDLDNNVKKLEINIYDMNGRLIKQINEGNQIHTQYIVDLGSMENGVYIVQTIVNDKTNVSKKILLYRNY